MTATEKNEHYRKLNLRFDERAAELRQLGFRYEHVFLFGQSKGVFVKNHPWTEKYNRVETAAMVMTADDVVWADRLADLSRPF